MNFRFGKKQLSDFVKVIQFMDKEGIDYEVVGDLSLAVGEPNHTEQALEKVPAPVPTYTEDPDPLWRPTDCPENCCDSRDKMKCKHRCHYGAQPLD